MPDLKTLLRSAGIPAADSQMEKLSLYLNMLLDWNTRMDLTSVSDGDMGERHFADSLLPLKKPGLFPPGCRVIDVGTGAGFPGLALALARPDCAFTLLEAQGKRCQFLEAVRRAAQAENVTVIQNRAEVLGQSPEHREQYDRALARAVAPLNVLCEYLLPFVRVGGMALCWKGPAAADELSDGSFAARALGGRMGELWEMALGSSRHVLLPIHKTQNTLPQYPRKNGTPAKRPLKQGKN